MATYPAYPTSAQLLAYLRGAGILPAAGDTPDAAEGLLYDLAIDAAITEWEDRTGYQPFLASDTAAQRRVYKNRYNPTQDWSLDGGIIPGSVTSLLLYNDLDPDDANPETFTSDEYAFLPSDAEAKSLPYTRLRFPLRPRTGYLAITARWGYCTTLPADAFQAVLLLATLSLADPARNLMASSGSGDITEIERSELRVKFGNSPTDRQRMIAGWEGAVKRAVCRYSRYGIR